MWQCKLLQHIIIASEHNCRKAPKSRAGCMVSSSVSSEVPWKNLYQPWGHRLWWALALAAGIIPVSREERPAVFNLGAVGALHQPCSGHLDFRSNVNSLFTSSASSSADAASKIWSVPLVHPCTGHLWLRSTEKNLGFTFSLETRLTVTDSTSWFFFTGTILIMIAALYDVRPIESSYTMLSSCNFFLSFFLWGRGGKLRATRTLIHYQGKKKLHKAPDRGLKRERAGAACTSEFLLWTSAG